MKKNLSFYFCKMDRIMAWALLASMVLFFLTGYGMTKGIINSEFAVSLHNTYLPFLIMIAFVFHAGYATRLAFIRWKFWNILGKAVWILFFVIFVIGYIYLEFFYEPYTSNETKEVVQSVKESKDYAETEIKEEESGVKIFSAEELAKYNGLDGDAPYVAVDGFVYDMTGVFKNGSHYGHKAGEELSDAFYLKHVKSSITKYPLVGEYSD